MRMGSRRDEPVQDIDLYRPARFSGKVLRLHYAREGKLQPYLGMVAAEGELYVQIWLRPGDEAVEITLGEERMKGSIPKELAGYL